MKDSIAGASARINSRKASLSPPFALASRLKKAMSSLEEFIDLLSSCRHPTIHWAGSPDRKFPLWSLPIRSLKLRDALASHTL